MKSLEHIPKAVADKLEAHAKVLHTLIAAQRRGAAEQFGYAFLAGRALLQAKAIVPNGNARTPNAGFKRWVEANLSEITLRTAENWMLFAESILARAQLDAVTSPLLLGSVEFTAEADDSILRLVPEVMDGKGMMRFMRDNRLLRMPERAWGGRVKNPFARSKKERSLQARRIWERIIADVDSAARVLSRIKSKSDLKRYLAVLLTTADKIQSLKPCKTRLPKSKPPDPI